MHAAARLRVERDVFGHDAETPARGRVEHARQRFVHDADDDDAAHVARRVAHQRAQREPRVLMRAALHATCIAPRSVAHLTRVLPMSTNKVVIDSMRTVTSPEMKRRTPVGCLDQQRAVRVDAARHAARDFAGVLDAHFVIAQRVAVVPVVEMRRQAVARKTFERGHQAREQRGDDGVAIRHRRAMRADVVGDVAGGFHGRARGIVEHAR